MVSLQREISASFPLLLVRGGAWLNTTPPMDKCDIYLVDKLYILRMKDDDMLPFTHICSQMCSKTPLKEWPLRVMNHEVLVSETLLSI